jgi:hypothetical protein
MIPIMDHQFLEVAGDVFGCPDVGIPIGIHTIGGVDFFLIVVVLFVVVIVRIAPPTSVC